MNLLRTLALSCALLSAAVSAQGIKSLSFNSDKEWLNFRVPNVQIKQQPGLQSDLWDKLSVDLVQQVSLNVARILYANEKDAPKLPTLDILLEDFKGIAWKEGNFSGAKIHISLSYLKKFEKEHGSDAVWKELVGVLYHEIAHAYQRDDHNYKNIGGVIEGVADVVRYHAGYMDFSTRKAGGNYDKGYKTTAFFLIWLDEKDERNLLQDLNLSLDATDDIVWNWQHFETHLGQSLEEEWKTYQSQLK